MVYNKLVRDKIPQMIENQGEKPNFRIMEEEEYFKALEQKLDEEVGEFHRDKNTEDLVDILEVVFALAKTLDCSVDELMRVFTQTNFAPLYRKKESRDFGQRFRSNGSHWQCRLIFRMIFVFLRQNG